ncbi:hypothetical protein Q3G72_016982 [Acer saccharum]|nr:hypothetical protein Q3G72_016982 [Acer saccharum]
MAMLGSFSAADFFPYVGWIVDFFTGLHARREKCFHEFDEFYQMVIDDHLDPLRPVPENEDIVDSMLRLFKNQSDGGILTQDHIKAILMNVFLGAIDTTSVTLVWAMTELMKNPRVMKKLQAEIRSSAGKINKPLVEETVCENLKYLKMLPDGMETEDLSMEEELGITVEKKIPLCLVPIKHI